MKWRPAQGTSGRTGSMVANYIHGVKSDIKTRETVFEMKSARTSKRGTTRTHLMGFGHGFDDETLEKENATLG